MIGWVIISELFNTEISKLSAYIYLNRLSSHTWLALTSLHDAGNHSYSSMPGRRN
ncbi:hypothetical protein IscW_ISCW008014 [Ixodes scapularis]|uniref:Uncharacterized protein n=1 Tax=Ixodes scapularis TaxID=6945 RepID=B7PVB1_IXOSC|nr:hypothetical protein IscW_ISCW008014 [Ixodes scapularis]|eukprot:XP_002407586.1 hypothetical protein IscW_ISCW008014 [Ixodes scapularis]